MHEIEITKELAREFALEIFDALVQSIRACEELSNDQAA